MHVLVTGANGLVGRRLVSVLAAKGHRVTALGRGPQRFEIAKAGKPVSSTRLFEKPLHTPAPSTTSEALDFLSKKYGVPAIRLEEFAVPAEVLELIPRDAVLKFRALPVNIAGKSLIVATPDPQNAAALAEIKKLTGLNVEPVVAPEPALLAAVHRFYGPAQITYVSLDLADARALTACVASAKPDVILNPASMTDVDGCERDPDGAWAANVDAVATLARAAKPLGAHLVHVSTDYVFDGDAGPYTVDSIPNPRGTYAITKLAGESAVRALCPAGTWAIARTAVVYGWPNTGKNNFGAWLVNSMREKKPVKLFEDQWVSPSHATNVAEMVAELGERKLSGIWNTAGSEVIDRVSFGRRFCRRFGFDESLVQPSRMADAKLLSPRPAKSGLDVSKTTATLAAKPLSLDASFDLLEQELKGEA